MNKNYQKGRRFEQKLVREEREKGNIAGRTAGSKSPIDLFSIDVKNKKIRFVQAKKGKSRLSKKEIKEFENLSDEYLVSFEVLIS